MPEEGMPRRFQGNVIFDCIYELVCQNLLDLTHADFLHSSLTGDARSEDDVIDVGFLTGVPLLELDDDRLVHRLRGTAADHAIEAL